MTNSHDNPTASAHSQHDGPGQTSADSEAEDVLARLRELQSQVQDLSSPEPSTSAATEPAATEPVATEPVAAEPVAAEPVAIEPVASRNANDEPTTAILSKLERQTCAIQILSSGLDQMQHQIAVRVIEAIREANLTASVATAEATNPEATNSEAAVAEAASAELPAELISPEADAAPPAAAEPAEDPEVPAAAPVNSWDSIRQSFLDASADNAEESTEAEEPPSEPEAPEPAAPTTADTADETCEPPPPLNFTIPDPFDCSTIEDDALRAVFIEREDILRLMSLHLLQRRQPAPVMSTEQLRELADTLPDELRERVEQALSRLDEQHRLTELELSLERARMARQKISLEETAHRLENMARQMGFVIRDDGNIEGVPDQQDPSTSGRRWTKVLGFGR